MEAVLPLGRSRGSAPGEVACSPMRLIRKRGHERLPVFLFSQSSHLGCDTKSESCCKVSRYRPLENELWRCGASAIIAPVPRGTSVVTRVIWDVCSKAVGTSTRHY